MNRHRFVGEWLALLKWNVTFWPYLIWLHHASQVGVGAGTREPLRLPSWASWAPQPQKRQPGDQKSTVQKWHPPGKPCSLLLLKHCSDPWQIINAMGMPMAAKFLWHLWWPATKAETPPQNWFSMISCSSSRMSTGSCRNCETVICIFQVLAIGLWRGGKEINSRYSRQRIIARIPAMLATSTKYTNKILRLQSYPPKDQTIW